MLLPLGTDAPLYHYPIATILLILANCACYVLTGFADPALVEPWVLEYGHINPIEWLTSNFVHAGFSHLAGNMIFLWAFGLIVEGKLGLKGMLGIYLGIGIGQCAIEQLMMLPMSSGGSLGASAAVMGLMAICFVWAPKNEFSTFIILFIWPIFFEITIFWYCIVCVVEQLFGLFAFRSAEFGSSLTHMMGIFVGFGLGTLYLKKGWVNCEKWDLYRVMAGTYGPYAEKETDVGNHADPTLMFGNKDVAVKDADSGVSKRSKSRQQKRAEKNRVDQLVDAGKYLEADEALFNARLKDPAAQLNESRLKKLALGLIQINMPDSAEIFLEEAIERFPDDCHWARLRLAQITLVVNKRPQAALEQLKQIKRSTLSESQMKLAKKLAGAAKKQIDDGVLDAEPEW